MAYFKSLIFAAAPTLAILIALDSLYYKTLTFTAYNFLYKNIIENVSAKFGVSPFEEYIITTLPKVMSLNLIFFVIGTFLNIKETFNLKKFPYFLLFILTYLIIVSFIPHKEERFILPIMPYIMLITGNCFYLLIRKFKSRKIAFIFILLALYEIFIFVAYVLC